MDYASLESEEAHTIRRMLGSNPVTFPGETSKNVSLAPVEEKQCIFAAEDALLSLASVTIRSSLRLILSITGG